MTEVMNPMAVRIAIRGLSVASVLALFFRSPSISSRSLTISRAVVNKKAKIAGTSVPCTESIATPPAMKVRPVSPLTTKLPTKGVRFK